MAEPGPRALHPAERHWMRFIDAVTLVWLGVFLLVLFHLDHPVLSWLAPETVRLLDEVVFWMSVLFIVDLVLQYSWSGLPLRRFLRLRWFDVLMAIPFLRPLRALRIFRVGRLARAFRVLTRGRRLLGLYRKAKRAVRSAFAKRAADPGEAADASGLTASSR